MIKTFEEYSNPSFKEIDYDEYDIIYQSKTIRSKFNQREISMIENIVKKYKMVAQSSSSSIINICNSEDGNDFVILVTIDKLNDDWFYVNDGDYNYYKCDQIEGLLECLDEILEDYDDSINESNSYSEVNFNDVVNTVLEGITERELYQIVNHLEKFGIDTDKINYSGRKPYELKFNLKDSEYTTFYANSITKLKDEWFVFYIHPDKYYKCDQIGGLLECLEEVLGEHSINESISNEYYYKLNKSDLDNEFEGTPLIDEDNLKNLKDKLSSRYGDRFDITIEISSYGISMVDRYSKIRRYIWVYIYPDEWYVVESMLPDGTFYYFKCDQLEGLFKCLDMVVAHNRDENMNESIDYSSEYYKLVDYRDIKADPTVLFTQVEMDRIFDYLEKLGVNMGDVYCEFSYNDIHEIRWADNVIFKQDDEWFIYNTFGPDYDEDMPSKYFKCDQLEGLFKCLDDVLGGSKVNESKLYSPINDITGIGKRDRFSSLELDELRDYCMDNGLNRNYYDNCFTILDPGKRLVNIYKYNDGWFLVKLFDDRRFNHMYKCDQLDGLIQCLKTIF